MDYQDSDAKININGFSIGCSSTGLRLSFEILIDELKDRFAEKVHFEQRDVSIMMAFFKILDCGDCDARRTATDFSKKNCFTSKKILMEANLKVRIVVFLDKSEVQHGGILLLVALLGVPSIWGSQNGMFQ